MATAAILNIQVESNEAAATLAAKLGKDATYPGSGIRALVKVLEGMVGGVRSGKVTLAVDSTTNVTKASGTLTFGGQPAADETVRIGGTTLTYKVVPVGESQVAVGANQAAAEANLTAKINAHSALVGIVTAEDGAGVVTVRSVLPGKIGNAIAMSATGGTITAAAALTGGVSTQALATRSWAMGTV